MPDYWLLYIINADSAPLISVKKTIRIFGRVDSHIVFGGLKTKSSLFLADTLAVNILFGTKFNSPHILGIIPKNVEIIPHDS